MNYEGFDRAVIEAMSAQGYLPVDKTGSPEPVDEDAYARAFYTPAANDLVVTVKFSGAEMRTNRSDTMRDHLIRARCAGAVLDAMLAKVESAKSANSAI